MLKGRVALVTGSVQGIGYATAQALAAQGAHIMLSGLGDAAEIEKLRKGMEDKYAVRVCYHGGDLSNRNQVDDLAETTIRDLGSLDILVNNAAVRAKSSIEEIALEAWDLSLEVNLTAPLQLMKRALPHMRRKNWGRIINVSSGWGLIGLANRVDYVTTKTGLIGMTRATAMEIKGTKITCNAVCPGATLTPRQEARIDSVMAQENVTREVATRKVLDALPGERFVSSDNVASTIAFLCSEAGEDISGVALPIDGGFTAGAVFVKQL